MNQKMNRNTENKNESGKIILEAFAAITAVTLLFSVLTESVLAKEIKKVEVVPTSYNVTSISTKENSVPDGYTKANYTVVADPLVNNKPTSKDMTMEEAAEIGAQRLWEIWGVDLDGATIYMSYEPVREDYPRATWSGDVRFGPRTPETDGYYVTVDAVTGESFIASMSRTISENVPLGLDAALDKNPEEYEKLAWDLAEKHNFVDGKVASSKYNSQGYAGNDPQITIYVTGVNGGTASLSFSRYDKTFTGLIYPKCFAISEMAMEKLLSDIEKGIQNDKEGVSETESASAELIAIS